MLAVLLGSLSIASADDKPQHPEMWMFDDKPIKATSPGQTAAKTFSINGHLYSRVFYDRPIKDVFSLTPTSYQIRVWHKLVEANSGSSATIWIAPKDFDNKWLDVEIFPDPKIARTKFGAYGETFHRTWSEAGKKVDGTHEVHFEIVVGGANGSAPDELAEADRRAARVTIDFTGHDPKRQAERSQLVAAAGNEAFSSNFSLPKPGRLHTAALAKAAAAMTKKNGRDVVEAKVIFTAAEWGIERHEVSGKTLARVAGASAVVKTRAGKCQVEPGVIRQPFVGGKFKGPGAWMNTSSTPYQIACDKAFK